MIHALILGQLARQPRSVAASSISSRSGRPMAGPARSRLRPRRSRRPAFRPLRRPSSEDAPHPTSATPHA